AAVKGGDLGAGPEALDLHWEDGFDLVPGLPFAGDAGVAVGDGRLDRGTVDGKGGKSLSGWGCRVERTDVAARDAEFEGELFWLGGADGEIDLAAPGIIRVLDEVYGGASEVDIGGDSGI